MDNPREINTRQLINFAKENGFNSVKFIGHTPSGSSFVGKFLDAYYEFIQIPVIGKGFIMLSDLEEQLGYDMKFNVLNDEEYEALLKLDYIIHGMTPPDEEEK